MDKLIELNDPRAGGAPLAVRAASPKRGCLMAMLPGLGSMLPNWAAEHIRGFDLHEEGIETEVHVTVLYGFKLQFDSNRLATLLETIKPPMMTLGRVSRFECAEYDVLKVDVKSPDLIKLNAKLAEQFSTDIVPSEYAYHPHLTIAYVKKGTCRDLDGNTDFENFEPSGLQMLYSLPEKKGRRVFNIGSKLVQAVDADPELLLRLLDEELVTRAMVIASEGEGQAVKSSEARFDFVSDSLVLSAARSTPTSVKATIKDDAGDVLLLKDIRSGNWDLPGGHKLEGETDYETLVREVKEETGLDLVEARFINSTPKAVFYEATVAGTRPAVTLSEEHTAFKWERPGRAKHDTAFWTGGFASHDAIRNEAQSTVEKAVSRLISLGEAHALAGRTNDEQFTEDAALILAAALAIAYATAAPKMGETARGADFSDVTTKAEEERYVKGRAGDLKGFPRDVQKRLEAERRRGKALGESDREIAQRIHGEGDSIREGAGRRLSETEAQAVYGHAALRAFKRAGFKTVFWVTVGDERVRPSHTECEKAGAVELGKPFPNGLHFPGDTEHGGLEETVNCRCWLEGGRKR